MPANISEGNKKKDITVKLDKPNWLKVEGDNYKVDHVINAYLTGKESALKDLAKTVERQQNQTLIKGMELTDELLEIINEKVGVGFVEARLKQFDLFNIESLIILEREAYFSNKVDDVYEAFFKFEDQIEIDFDIEFKFTFYSDHLNKEQLKLDGFEYFRN